MAKRTDLTHKLELRLTPLTVVNLDEIIENDPLFRGMNRCSFMRACIEYGIYAAFEERREQV